MFNHTKLLKKGDRVEVKFTEEGWVRATVVRHWRRKDKGYLKVVYDIWKDAGEITIDDWVAVPVNVLEQLSEIE